MSSPEGISEGSSIQITMPESDHIPSQRHEQTPVAASPQLDAKGGVNENTPVEDLSSLKRKVYVYALRDMWLEAQPIFHEYPNMLRIQLTANRDDTALHVAVSARSPTFVEGLINLMNPEDLIIPTRRRTIVEVDDSISREGSESAHSSGSMDDQCMDDPMDAKLQSADRIGPKSEIHLHNRANLWSTVCCTAPPILKQGSSSQLDMNQMMSSAADPGSPEYPSLVAGGAGGRNMGIPKPWMPSVNLQPGNQDAKMGHHRNTIELMFFTNIENNMFGPALKLLEKYPQELGLARHDPRNYQKALNMLAKKPSLILNKVRREKDGKEDRKRKEGLQLLKRLYLALRKMKEDSKTESWMLLFSFVKSGNLEAVKCLIDNNSELNTELLMTSKDTENGMSLLHQAVLRRHRSVVFYIFELATNYFNIQGSRSSDPESSKDNLILGGVDNEGNNVLHLAARCQHGPGVHESRAKVKMQNDLAWFKEIEKKIHEFSYNTMVNDEEKKFHESSYNTEKKFHESSYNTMVNDEGKTPKEIFYDKHKDLSEEIKKAVEGIANSGMIVAILVATVAFAAALTVPGDKTNAWFVVFIFTNALALFASSASILSFLSNFTSLRFAQSEFVKSLHPSLRFGAVLLFISVVAMVVAFAAASFLIFDHTSKWVSYAVASMGVVPILLFILFRFRFFDDHFWSRYYRLSKFE